ncbi:uncharacterized protein STAUR_2970 [Stigmatella aurantiaca DW4/3-1]|uniref:Uncharacterized protein n=1 Tax=Stigmatella aurantiaca (strain DW4/3-1) TaxID=378806 RepID=E3FQR9_STIAD|nr:uncharacterized protein STAUR_2970 [Stigmatella aurantiaca DW4/3-1]
MPPPLLDLVLQARSGTGRRELDFELFEGQPGVSRTVGFTAGYLDCSGDLGVGDREHSAFDGWIQEAGKTLPGQGWWSAFLQKFDSDERQALRAYVDAASEFRALSPAALASLTWRYGGSPPEPAIPRTLAATSRALLDVLLEMRRVGRILMYIGDARVERMAGYIDGYRLCLSLAGLKDEEYLRFERWLQDTSRVPLGHTWEDAFLQAAHGDHEAAIHRLLDCGAEFRALSSAC